MSSGTQLEPPELVCCGLSDWYLRVQGTWRCALTRLGTISLDNRRSGLNDGARASPTKLIPIQKVYQ